MTDLALKGCTYEPMSSYLSALAVLRLVSEQKDPDAKGWWDDLGVFHLDSCLDEEGLVNFFLEEYHPTPIVSPWNGGSGFNDGDNTDSINAIMEDDSERFAVYRETIRRIRSFPEIPNTDFPVSGLISFLRAEAIEMKGKKGEEFLELLDNTEKLAQKVPSLSPNENILSYTIEELDNKAKVPKKASAEEKKRSASIKSVMKEAKKIRSQVKQIQKKKGTGKEDIISACRDRLSDQVAEWIDASTLIAPDGKAVYPPILGTGGNDGRFEFSNNFMGCLRSMLLESDNFSKSLLRNAVLDKKTENLQKISIGQYDPSRTGGFNQGNGIENKDEFKANPWVFILTFEGSIPWASSVVKSKNMKLGGNHLIRSPFTVRSVQVGYSSSSEQEKSRAEIWMPLWKNPTDYKELKLFLSEGRTNVGRDTATNSIEFAEAATSLGVDRGISDFVRYNLLERRGKSYLALPAGIINVHYKEESDLIREINRPLSQIDSALRGDNVPGSFKSARRKIDKKLYDALIYGGKTNVKSLVSAIGEFEKLVSQSGNGNDPVIKKPISGLSPRWIEFADDGSLEVRIAAAIASIGPTGSVGSVRANISHVDPKNPYQWDKGRGQFAWEGNSVYARLSSVLARRMMDANRLGVKYNPLWGAIRISEEDISAFIEGRIDESLLENLIFGFSWINWNKKDEIGELRKYLFKGDGGWNTPVKQGFVSRPYALLKLLFLPDGIKKGDTKIAVKPEPSVISLLCANRINDACKIADRRLRTKDFIPVTNSFPDGKDGVRISAALLIPLGKEGRLKKLVLKEEKKI
ncbi:type I-G CRISPR-associated protein Cas8g1/Csx17 [Methanoplanus endosymbiosus]|uniref:Type I-U CRISPR-associated protein Csx17 n=1 Tax=Methanoplanus endosymbiosus TaxID=33865 RepID=A0A9E7TKY1_9EURY|nr:type I-U CRISPR-associated protein Csx17 [Methanoplanus endosymbiosus]UUX93120.1 type I-U CRISPR-associated protein Csx17 [Methanoplanus endosymbiosus]